MAREVTGQDTYAIALQDTVQTIREHIVSGKISEDLSDVFVPQAISMSLALLLNWHFKRCGLDVLIAADESVAQAVKSAVSIGGFSRAVRASTVRSRVIDGARQIEGGMKPNERTALVAGVLSPNQSLQSAIDAVRRKGVRITQILVVVADRHQRAAISKLYPCGSFMTIEDTQKDPT